MTELAADVSEAIGALAHNDLTAQAWEATHDGLALVGPDGTIIESNEAFDQLVRREAAAVDVCEVFAPEDIRTVMEACDPTAPVAVAGLGSDGFPFVAAVTASRADRDLTLLTVRSRLPSMATRAAAPEAAHEDLVHALSHDVRGRLRGVAGFLGMFVEQHGNAIESTGADLLERAAAAGRAGDSMLERLVRYLRLEDTCFVLAPEPLDEIIAAAAAACGGAGITVGEPLPLVLADRKLLTEAVVEILRNAVEYAGADESPMVVSISRRSSGWCELLMSDDGPGIPPELVAESFGIFRQLQARNWERGVGMGLPICRRIIDGHGGRVALRSDGRTGTTVALRLALAPAC